MTKSDKRKAIEIHDTIEELGFGKFQVILVIGTGLIWMADGIEITLLAILSSSLRCGPWKTTPFEETILSTLVFFGMIIIAYLLLSTNTVSLFYMVYLDWTLIN